MWARALYRVWMVATAIWWGVLVWMADEGCPARVLWTVILVPFIAGLILVSTGVIASGFRQENPRRTN